MKEQITRTPKLYKSKKLWIVAGAASALFAVHANSVSADTVDTQVTDVTQSQVSATNETVKEPAVDVVEKTKDATVETAKVSDETTTSNDTAKSSDQKDVTDAKASTDSSEQVKESPVSDSKTDTSKDATQSTDSLVTNLSTDAKDTQAQDAPKDSTSTETVAPTEKESTEKVETPKEDVKVEDTKQPAHFVTDDKTSQKQYVDDNGEVVKNAFKEIDGVTYYFNQSGDAVTGLQQINGQLTGFDANGAQVKSGFVSAANNDKYYFDKDGHAVSGVQQIDGQTYYFDSTGRQLKGYTAVINGVVTYFNATTGAADNTDASQIKTGVTVEHSDYTAHNAAYDTSDQSFDNINGYLTAESWYRPKDILVQDTNQETGEKTISWRASTQDDKRPILMTWQPDVTTEANYLNTMADNGLLSTTTKFSAASDLSVMNDAMRAVQENIEVRNAQEKSTDWLKSIMTNFVNSQPQWNETSEQVAGDHLQGGALKFVNSKLTPDANSNFRLMNRTPTNQSGVTRYHTDNSKGGYELLLANDVDNSNPTVQAEQLNWLYYLTHFGSITANDDDANFDGIRVDAVDNVDADLLQIASDYFKQSKGTNLSDKNAIDHLSLLEDWSSNDGQYIGASGNNQLTIDTYAQTQLLFSLTKQVGKRSSMDRFTQWYMIDRTNDTTENVATPNYSFVRAHDSEVQTVIGDIIKALHPDVKNALAPTKEQLAEAFEVYNADMLKTDKQYTQYNMPSAYAMLLTNKDTVPRVYYGDLFTDDGQYMAKKTPYYDTIANLMQSRVKYVSGGQSMAVDKNDILTSVRYGKDLMTKDATATSDESRNSGIGVIVSNNPDLKLSDSDTVTLHLGAAHANQVYQELVQSTTDGLNNNTANYKTTDANGDLVFDATEIKGFSNPQVSGFLAVWAPKDASETQDVRTAPTAEKSTDGNTLHSNAALDSQVIYEAFSNFQATPTTESEFANVKIAENAGLFKQLGITSMQLAPQYRSSTDTSFLDSIIQNGYAFTDRYDLGFNTPTKYGTDQQLRDALKAIHKNGMTAMADWVPDQIYNLPDTELVTASRTDAFGTDRDDSNLSNILYVSHTKGGGEYQAKYGGEFLDTLKKEVPSLFKTIQVSTGVPIDGNTKIKEWSAKYFNGSNIQGRGIGYVLSNSGTQDYFKVTSNSSNKNFLPTQLLGQATTTGFENTKDGVTYYSKSGIQAKSQFVKDETTGNYYYFNAKGLMTFGQKTIKGKGYMFLPNGVELRSAFLQNADGTVLYYGANGQQAISQYVFDQDGNSYHFNAEGTMDTGETSIDDVQQYFNENGTQVKDQIITTNGIQKYYHAGNGNLAKSEYICKNGQFYYANEDGELVTGLQKINGHQQYFASNGQQVKNAIVHVGDKQYYVDTDNGDVVTNQFVLYDGAWHYATADGSLASGLTNINDETKYFDANGVQVKDQKVTIGDKTYALDKDNGNVIKNQFVTYDGVWYYATSDGSFATGVQEVNGQIMAFDKSGRQIKGLTTIDNKPYYFDVDNGNTKSNEFFALDNKVYYATADGSLATGVQTINGSIYAFDEHGVQLTGDQVINGQRYSFDTVTGVAETNRWIVVGSQRYYAGANGNVLTGPQVIDGKNYVFDDNGVQATDDIEINGVTYIVDKQSGLAQTNAVVKVNGKTLHTGDNGEVLIGQHVFNNEELFFGADGTQGYHLVVDTADGYKAYYDSRGLLTRNQFVMLNDTDFGYADANGHLVTGWQHLSDGIRYYNQDGVQLKGSFAKIDGQLYGFEKSHGVLVRDNYFSPDNGQTWYHADDNGVLTLA